MKKLSYQEITAATVKRISDFKDCAEENKREHGGASVEMYVDWAYGAFALWRVLVDYEDADYYRIQEMIDQIREMGG